MSQMSLAYVVGLWVTLQGFGDFSLSTTDLRRNSTVLQFAPDAISQPNVPGSCGQVFKKIQTKTNMNRSHSYSPYGTGCSLQ